MLFPFTQSPHGTRYAQVLFLFFVVVYIIVQSVFIIMRTHEGAALQWAWAFVLLPSYIGIFVYWGWVCYAGVVHFCFSSDDSQQQHHHYHHTIVYVVTIIVPIFLLWFLSLLAQKLENGGGVSWAEVMIPLTIVFGVFTMVQCASACVFPKERAHHVRSSARRVTWGIIAFLLFLQTLFVGIALDRAEDVQSWTWIFLTSYLALLAYLYDILRDVWVLHRARLRSPHNRRIGEILTEMIIWISFLLFLILLNVHAEQMRSRQESAVSLTAIFVSLIGLPVALLVYAWYYYHKHLSS